MAPQVETATPKPKNLDDLLWERYSALLHIKRRLYFLEAFQEELHAVTQGKRFHIRNGILWRMALDCRDKLAIDLYSWSVELRHGVRPKPEHLTKIPGGKKKKGLFYILRERHRSELQREYTAKPGDDEDELRSAWRHRAERFDRLFPGAFQADAEQDSDTEEATCEEGPPRLQEGTSPTCPSPADLDDLCESFRLKMEPLGLDRNKNRAHAFEGDIGTAKMLSLHELSELFSYAEQLLEDLSFVSSGASYARANMNDARCDETARDLVDQIVLGYCEELKELFKSRSRDGTYARLHQMDQAREPVENDRDRYFNDLRFEPEFFP